MYIQEGIFNLDKIKTHTYTDTHSHTLMHEVICKIEFQATRKCEWKWWTLPMDHYAVLQMQNDDGQKRTEKWAPHYIL